MKRSEIKVGEVYAWRVGRGGAPRKALILNVEHDDYHNVGSSWVSDSSDLDRLHVKRGVRHHGWRSGRPLPRFLAAVEFPVRKQFMENPETGEPWDDYFHKTHGRSLVVGARWVPMAVAARELIYPWARQEEINAERARQEAAARAAREVQEAAARKRAEEQRAENERVARERAVVRAQNVERFETHVQPILDDLGIEYHHDSYAGGKGDRVTIDVENLHELLHKLGAARPTDEPVS